MRDEINAHSTPFDDKYGKHGYQPSWQLMRMGVFGVPFVLLPVVIVHAGQPATAKLAIEKPVPVVASKPMVLVTDDVTQDAVVSPSIDAVTLPTAHTTQTAPMQTLLSMPADTEMAEQVTQSMAMVDSAFADFVGNQTNEVMIKQTNTVNTAVGTTQYQSQADTKQQPVAMLGKPETAIGLPSDAPDNLNVSRDISQNKQAVANKQPNSSGDLLNPDAYLPEYETQATTQTDAKNTNKPETFTEKQPNFFVRLYHRLLHDGVIPLAKVEVNLRQQQPDAGKSVTYTKVDTETQPYKNIQTALEDITVESISDFRSALPRVRSIAKEAAQAVGYYNTEFYFEKTAADRLQVTIKDLGEPITVTGRVVDIRGQAKDLPVFQHMQTEAKPQLGSVLNQGEYEASKATMVSTLLALGFFDGQWLNHSIEIVLPDNTADVELIYDSGERYYFGDVVFATVLADGSVSQDPEKLPLKASLLQQLLPFKTGDAFDRALVSQLSTDLLTTQYFNNVDVEVFNPSPEESVGDEDITFSDEMTDDQLVENAELANEPTIQDQGVTDVAIADTSPANDGVLVGDSMADDGVNYRDKDKDQDKDDSDNNGLIGADVTQILLDLNTETDAIKASKRVPILVLLDANKPNSAEIGLGYGSDTGVRVRGQLRKNLINKQGYNADVNLGISKIKQAIDVRVSRPYGHPLNDRLIASTGYERTLSTQTEGNLNLAAESLKLGVERQIKTPNNWLHAVSLKYQLDRLTVDLPADQILSLPAPFNASDSKLKQQSLLLGYRASQRKVDNAINPTRGYSHYYSVELGSEDMVTDTDLAILRAGVAGIYSFGDSNKHQLFAKMDAGTIITKDFVDVPYKLRFFAGGDRSIRGYAYNSLSPFERGYTIGGQNLLTANVEYNYALKPGLRLASFVDVGNAYDKDFSNDTEIGLGLGVRWESPVGSVRLDIASGITEPDKPIRLHFFIGSLL